VTDCYDLNCWERYIRALYEIENKIRAKNLSGESFLEERKKAAQLVLEKFKSGLLKRVDEVPPSNLLGTAVKYTLNQWDKLTAYLGSYHLTPDNNAAENAIRPFVIGRNYVLNKIMCSMSAA
jgi:transposase